MRFQGVVYRAHNPQWAWDPLSGEGARRHGGRFNRRNLPALYTSLLPLTAIREAEPLGRPMQPLILCAYEADVEPIFDALDESRRAEYSVSDSDLCCPNWERDMLDGIIPLPHALADQLIAEGFAGMRVQSFAREAESKDINLILWRWGAQRPSRIALIDDEGRLTKNLKDPMGKLVSKSPDGNVARVP